MSRLNMRLYVATLHQLRNNCGIHADPRVKMILHETSTLEQPLGIYPDYPRESVLETVRTSFVRTEAQIFKVDEHRRC